MNAVVPIANMTRRIPEAGRIRTGMKTKTSGGKERPTAIPEFRFTSHDTAALEAIASMYGGTVQPWSDPKAADGQWEVITEATEIRIVLPPDPLGGTPIYELWGGGGCERRCDGLTAQVLTQGPDGLEPTEVPCLCDAKGEMSCNVVTRLSVMLPEVNFAGVWRLDTKSWNAAQELPGMVDMIQSMQAQGLTYATLSLRHRRTTRGGQTRKFIIPVLGLPASIEQLAAGQARLTGISSGQPEEHRALEAGDDPAVGSGVDPEEPAEGELLEEDAEHDEAEDAEVVHHSPAQPVSGAHDADPPTTHGNGSAADTGHDSGSPHVLAGLLTELGGSTKARNQLVREAAPMAKDYGFDGAVGWDDLDSPLGEAVLAAHREGAG